MLKTLDHYQDYEPAQEWLLEPFWRRFTRNRRCRQILAASVIGHLLGIILLIRLDMVRTIEAVPERGSREELVQIAELAPPERTPRLRSTAEAIERADPADFRFDPKTANDLNLTARSSTPTTARGIAGGARSNTLPSASQIEQQARRMQRVGEANRPAGPSPPALQPPEISQVASSRMPQQEPTVPASSIPTPSSQAPPAPPQPRPAAAAAAPPAGQRGGDASQTTTLGFQAVEAQYLAYVRAKIRKINEGIMPRKWIETVLADKVSADFEIIVRRDGRISSVKKFRSSGYVQLDDIARQAIYMANPFEGYPQEAGDTITLTVTVYYTPGR